MRRRRPFEALAGLDLPHPEITRLTVHNLRSRPGGLVSAAGGIPVEQRSRVTYYSSGMQVRLAYSVAIQVPFDILLVDEVLAVGDARFQQKCAQTFDEFRAAGKTVVLVTHDPHAVRVHCERAMLIENGTVDSIGPAGEVVDRYFEHEGISESD